MNTFYSMVALTLVFSTPILITALGGLFSERSGVINIALEGLMMFGAFSTATVTVLCEPYTIAAPWIALGVGMAVAASVALFYAYLSVRLFSDQIIAGTAINLCATGMTVFFAQVIFGQQGTQAYSRGLVKTSYGFFSRIPVLGPMVFTHTYPTVYLGFVLVALAWYVLYRTPFGVHVRATGDQPYAVDGAGLSVFRLRSAAVVISGLCAGLGGGVLILTQDIQYTVYSTHGTGFIALAALISGRWHPFGVLVTSVLFGFSQILNVYATSVELLKHLPIELFSALPYALTVVVLLLFGGRGEAPRAIGQPYDRARRY